MTTRKDLESEAEQAARSVARDAARRGLPPDAGAIGNVTQAVRDAWEAGRREAVAEVVEAYRLFIEADDLDAFRDTITGMMPTDLREAGQLESEPDR